MSVASSLGTIGLFFSHLASMTSLFVAALYWMCIAPWRERRPGFSLQSLIRLMYDTGYRSLPIVLLIGALAGIILALETGGQLQRFGQVQLVAGLVALSMARSLGPLLTAIVITGRVGAAYTAELGTMKVSEEILALEVMAINPVGYLVAPRLLALLIMLPCLTVFADLMGLVGGYLIGTTVYHISSPAYVHTTLLWLSLPDIFAGLLKSIVFATIIGLVGCYRALVVEGGPEGVGQATMVSVVTTIVLIIVADGIFTALLA
jgi:phospholipid/cholesterol/gamma-HCH transport system permease protein